MGKKKGQAAAGTSKDDDDDALLDAAIAENAKSKSMEAAKAPDGMHGQLKGLTPEKVSAMSPADKIRHVCRHLPGKIHPHDTPLMVLAGMGGGCWSRW